MAKSGFIFDVQGTGPAQETGPNAIAF